MARPMADGTLAFCLTTRPYPPVHTFAFDKKSSHLQKHLVPFFYHQPNSLFPSFLPPLPPTSMPLLFSSPSPPPHRCHRHRCRRLMPRDTAPAVRPLYLLAPSSFIGRPVSLLGSLWIGLPALSYLGLSALIGSNRYRRSVPPSAWQNFHLSNRCSI